MPYVGSYDPISVIIALLCPYCIWLIIAPYWLSFTALITLSSTVAILFWLILPYSNNYGLTLTTYRLISYLALSSKICSVNLMTLMPLLNHGIRFSITTLHPGIWHSYCLLLKKTVIYELPIWLELRILLATNIMDFYILIFRLALLLHSS